LGAYAEDGAPWVQYEIHKSVEKNCISAKTTTTTHKAKSKTQVNLIFPNKYAAHIICICNYVDKSKLTNTLVIAITLIARHTHTEIFSTTPLTTCIQVAHRTIPSTICKQDCPRKMLNYELTKQIRQIKIKQNIIQGWKSTSVLQFYSNFKVQQVC